MRNLGLAERAADRRGILGASEVAEVLGLAPWADASPMRVWRRKCADAAPEAPTDAQLRGQVLELVRETGGSTAPGGEAAEEATGAARAARPTAPGGCGGGVYVFGGDIADAADRLAGWLGHLSALVGREYA